MTRDSIFDASLQLCSFPESRRRKIKILLFNFKMQINQNKNKEDNKYTSLLKNYTLWLPTIENMRYVILWKNFKIQTPLYSED